MRPISCEARGDLLPFSTGTSAWVGWLTVAVILYIDRSDNQEEQWTSEQCNAVDDAFVFKRKSEKKTHKYWRGGGEKRLWARRRATLSLFVTLGIRIPFSLLLTQHYYCQNPSCPIIHYSPLFIEYTITGIESNESSHYNWYICLYLLQWNTFTFAIDTAAAVVAAARSYLLCITSHVPNAYNDILDTLYIDSECSIDFL